MSEKVKELKINNKEVEVDLADYLVNSKMMTTKNIVIEDTVCNLPTFEYGTEIDLTNYMPVAKGYYKSISPETDNWQYIDSYELGGKTINRWELTTQNTCYIRIQDYPGKVKASTTLINGKIGDEYTIYFTTSAGSYYTIPTDIYFPSNIISKISYTYDEDKYLWGKLVFRVNTIKNNVEASIGYELIPVATQISMSVSINNINGEITYSEYAKEDYLNSDYKKEGFYGTSTIELDGVSLESNISLYNDSSTTKGYVDQSYFILNGTRYDGQNVPKPSSYYARSSSGSERYYWYEGRYYPACIFSDYASSSQTVLTKTIFENYFLNKTTIHYANTDGSSTFKILRNWSIDTTASLGERESDTATVWNYNRTRIDYYFRSELFKNTITINGYTYTKQSETHSDDYNVSAIYKLVI